MTPDEIRDLTFVPMTYGDLQDGDVLPVQGHLFRIRNVRKEQIDVGTVIRFEGDVVDSRDDIAGTGYDGGTYGGVPTIRVGVHR